MTGQSPDAVRKTYLRAVAQRQKETG